MSRNKFNSQSLIPALIKKKKKNKHVKRRSANTDDLRNSLTHFSTFLDTSNGTCDYHYTSRQSCRHFPLAHTSPINPVAASTPTRVSLLPRWCPSAKRRLNNQPWRTVQLSYLLTQSFYNCTTTLSRTRPLPKKLAHPQTPRTTLMIFRDFSCPPRVTSDHRPERKGRLMRRPRTVINER